MPEFLRLLTPDIARERVLTGLGQPQLDSTTIDSSLALGRVTSQEVVAPYALPEFPRSTVDGYAVRAVDTFGASDSLPAYLRVKGEIPMGAVAPFKLAPAECALIHTGGMLPLGADAVVMLEHTQRIGRAGGITEDVGAPEVELEVLKAVAGGENVIKVGEDVAEGQVVIRRGVRLRPAEIGGLMALGITELRVVNRPRVGIISSGDEVVDPHRRPEPGRVRDINAYALSALVSQAGGEPRLLGILPDSYATIRDAAAQGLEGCEVLIISGGSSASTRDMTADVIASLGQPGVLVHGVNIRPGKPTILGLCDGKAVIGLPGNPVSALVIGYLLVVPVIEHLLGLPDQQPPSSVRARLSVNLPSQAGREDWWPVRLKLQEGQEDEWVAEPIFGKSNLIFTLVTAHGLLRIPPDATGLSAGDAVVVRLLA